MWIVAFRRGKWWLPEWIIWETLYLSNILEHTPNRSGAMKFGSAEEAGDAAKAWLPPGWKGSYAIEPASA